MCLKVTHSNAEHATLKRKVNKTFTTKIAPICSWTQRVCKQSFSTRQICSKYNEIHAMVGWQIRERLSPFHCGLNIKSSLPFTENHKQSSLRTMANGHFCKAICEIAATDEGLRNRPNHSCPERNKHWMDIKSSETYNLIWILALRAASSDIGCY